MLKSIVRGVVVLAISMTIAPTESRACCFSHCFDCFKCARPTTYAAPYAAPACDVCPQQVNYVPQTCYRTEYTCVPCTSYRPVTSCDPCGGAQTVMQPVTTYVRRPVMVPFTTYRPVVSQVRYATPACTTCGTAAAAPYYSGVTAASVTMPAPASGCATCGGGAGVPYGAAPAVYNGSTYISQPAMTSAPVGTPTMAAPAMGSSPSGQTYQPNAAPAQNNSSMYPVQPVPDTDSKLNPSAAPLLNPQVRSASTRPLLGPAWVTPAIFRVSDQAKVFQPAAQAKPVPPTDGWSTPKATDDGWQPASGN